MATIPNLNTLRASRQSARGRGGARSVVNEGEGQESSEDTKDTVIQQTDQDASVSRLSAVSLGYLDDPFAKELFQLDAPRRYPIINRGTYVRTSAIDSLVTKFLAVDPASTKQIVSLGAGSDTRFFRLISRNRNLRLLYHELDFPAITAKKIACIQTSPLLSWTLRSESSSTSEVSILTDNASLHSSTLNIHPVDLRALASSDINSVKLPNMDPDIPTLIISECCLVYIPPSVADAIIRNLASKFFASKTPLGFLLYEPICPFDAFGKVMVSNLKARGIHLETLKKYSSLYRQRERMKVAGLKGGAGALDTLGIWQDWISKEEKERVGRLEMLDELEEWELLAKHYCIAWGWRDGDDTGQDVFGKAWTDIVGRGGVEDESENAQ